MSTDCGIGVDNYDWIELCITSHRLQPFRELASGSTSEALRLYAGNIHISADVFQWLACLEVFLRNAIFRQLQNETQQEEEDFDPFTNIWHELTPKGRRDLELARSSIRARGQLATPNKIVAELNFGFWRYLLAARYESSLWTKTIRKAFPNMRPQRRAKIYEAVERLNALRNQIAHHERLDSSALNKDLEILKRVMGWISTDALAWATSNLPEVKTN